MGVVNSKKGVTAKILCALCAQSVLCLPIQKFLWGSLVGCIFSVIVPTTLVCILFDPTISTVVISLIYLDAFYTCN